MASEYIEDDGEPLPQWVRDYLEPPKPRTKNAPQLPNPPGYSEAFAGKRIGNQSGSSKSNSKSVTATPSTSDKDTDSLKLKKSWELALAPAKALPMNAIMMYMSGNSLQIFSIMMVFMLFKNPLTGLMQTNEVFRRYETESNKQAMLAVKACYVLMQLAALGLGLWKVNAMGLLPTTRSDWLAWETAREPAQRVKFTF